MAISLGAHSWSRVVLALQLVVAVFIGSVILPWLFGDVSAIAAYSSYTARYLGWVVVALLASIWIVVLSARAVGVISLGLAMLPSTQEKTGRERPEVLAALIVVACDIVVLNSILQLPLSAAVVILFSHVSAESLLGVLAVALLLAVMVQLYFVARPYIEGSAWSALDVVIATTSSEVEMEATVSRATTRPAVTQGSAPAVTATPDTVLDTRQTNGHTLAKTVVDSSVDGPTLLAGDPGIAGPDATQPDNSKNR